MKLSLILPCYNEQEAVDSVLTEIFHYENYIVDETDFKSIEVIFVDDGSSDDSLEMAKDYPVKIVRHVTNLGYGAALKTGMKVAEGDWVLFYDLDSTCHLKDLVPMWVAHKRRGHDIFSGQRLTSSTEMPFHRQIGNQFFKNLVRLTTGRGCEDACSGYRFFHRKYIPIFLEQLPDKLNFTLAMTVLALKNNWKFAEVPIQYTERKGPSKLNELKEGLRFLQTVLRYSLKKPAHAKF